jgi:secreted PhoX family phosphatase
MGQIIRWKEAGDFSGLSFAWNHLMLAGDPANERPDARGNIKGDIFAGPDTIAFDERGVLWIGTDFSANSQGEFARMGHNQLLACNPVSGEVRRFLVGPARAEITGAAWTPDGRTMFINIQHPGSGSPRDGSNPRQFSNWPDFNPTGRPRSATVVVRRLDGGVVGA